MNKSNYDHVIIVDRLSLSGGVLSDLIGEVFKCSCKVVSCFTQLSWHLQDKEDDSVLIILDVVTDSDSLSDGLATLERLQPLIKSGSCRVVVYTAFEDPIILEMILNRSPTAMVLRREPLSTVLECVQIVDNSWPFTFRSKGVRNIMMSSGTLALTPRESTWLLTQINQMSLEESAAEMNIGYKTAASFRCSIIKTLGVNNRLGLSLWVERLRKKVSHPAARSCKGKKERNPWGCK